MTQLGKSLKSGIRKSVINAYRARGRGNSNIWLIYSEKTQSDWLLTSDRQLIHWIINLELNACVQTFDFSPEPIITHDGSEDRKLEVDVIVTKNEGLQEWHKVSSGISTSNSKHEALERAAALAKVSYKSFDDNDLKPKVKVAMRWIKAIGFSTAIRGNEQAATNIALVLLLKEWKQGVVGALLEKLVSYDRAVVLGLIVRLTVKGVISINLEKMPFGLRTPWTYHE